VTGLRLLIALSALAVRLMLLIRRQSIHPMSLEDAMHGRASNLDAMESVQIRRDPAWSEVIVLAQVENLADHLACRRSRRSLWPPRPIAQAGVTVLGVSPLPFVERLPRSPEPTANSSDILLVCRLL
jgi:hypothetical protein